MKLDLRTVPALIACAILAGAVSGATATPKSEVVPPRLYQLLSGARLVVAGRVSQVETFDSGRLAIADVAVVKTLKGAEPTGPVKVLELRSLPSTPPIFSSGESVLVFLGPAARTSYVRSHVAPGDYLQATEGRDGVIAAPDPAVIDQAAAIVARMVTASREPEPDPDKRRASDRALLFDELAARHPAIVEDGIAGLATLPQLLPLGDDERARLASVVTRSELPARIRERLFAQVAALHIADMVPPLRDVRSDDAAVTAAAWEALRRLGAAPAGDDIAAQLRSKDATVRAAAARELLARGDAAELDRAGRLALDDPEPKVRLAVIEALAQTGSATTLVILEKAFGDPQWDVRQGAGRAIFQIGGRPAAESFARLTFTASPEMQRYAVTLLRASGVASDDPLLVRIRTDHPDAQVREVAENGLPRHEH